MRNEMDHMNPEPAPKSTGFGQCLVSTNGLGELGFEEWVFHPGMLFNSIDKWWGNSGCRNTPHEGLDLCFYRTKDREVRRLNERISIPVIFEGEVVKLGNDFLGVSVYVRHSLYNNRGEQLLTAYGHTKPYDDIYPGRKLMEGALIGTIAEVRKRKLEIPPHIHISIAWISKSIRYEELDWEYISDPRIAVLLDPLEIIDCRYSILDSI